MSRVVSIHALRLKAGVSEEQWERYLRDEVMPALLPGWKVAVGKSDRGPAVGSYTLIAEFDSPGVRDRYFPMEGQLSEEARPVAGPALARLLSLVDDDFLGDFEIVRE